MEAPNRRHWSFVVTDKRYIYPLAAMFLLLGLAASFLTRDASHFPRVGNFIIGAGVWISMRYTLREGLKRSKDLSEESPFIPGTTAINATFFNNIAFSIGDAQLQVHGFLLVLVGSTIGSFGDLLLKWLFPHVFH